MENKLEITSSDAWVIQSVFRSEEADSGAELTRIIAFADYVNHGIPSFHEFESGIRKGICLRVLEEKEGKLFTTQPFKEWAALYHSGRRQVVMLQEMEAIREYLQQLAKEVTFSSRDRNIEISEEEYNQAVRSYLKK